MVIDCYINFLIIDTVSLCVGNIDCYINFSIIDTVYLCVCNIKLCKTFQGKCHYIRSAGGIDFYPDIDEQNKIEQITILMKNRLFFGRCVFLIFACGDNFL